MEDKQITQEMFDTAMDHAESVEDVLEAMRSFGVEVTEAELDAFVGGEGSSNDCGELAEEDLDNVSGGWVSRLMMRMSYTMLRHARQRLQMTLMRVRMRSLYRFR